MPIFKVMSSMFGNIKLKTKAIMTPINNASPGLENNEVMKERKENEIRDFRNFSTNRIAFRTNALRKRENKTRANPEFVFSFFSKISLDTYIFSCNKKYNQI